MPACTMNRYQQFTKGKLKSAATLFDPPSSFNAPMFLMTNIIVRV